MTRKIEEKQTFFLLALLGRCYSNTGIAVRLMLLLLNRLRFAVLIDRVKSIESRRRRSLALNPFFSARGTPATREYEHRVLQQVRYSGVHSYGPLTVLVLPLVHRRSSTNNTSIFVAVSLLASSDKLYYYDVIPLLKEVVE